VICSTPPNLFHTCLVVIDAVFARFMARRSARAAMAMTRLSSPPAFDAAIHRFERRPPAAHSHPQIRSGPEARGVGVGGPARRDDGAELATVLRDLLHPARRSSVTRLEPSADGTISVVGAAAAGEWHVAGVHTVA
jgi:hypothetical protein